jgi:biotin-dependent carboxylase-like uncharacterized protein
MKLEFLTGGLRTTTQDGGRVGHTHIGVPVGGALDRSAMEFANSLVGNPLHSPVLEITLTGPRLKCIEAGTVALVGGDFDLLINGRKTLNNKPVLLNANDEIAIERKGKSCRTYLAVGGDWLVVRWLGSASALRIGSHEFLPDAVWQAGQTLNTRELSVKPWPKAVLPPLEASALLTVFPGPEYSWLDKDSGGALVGSPLQVVDPSNRIGLRTQVGPAASPPALKASHKSEMTSSGVQPGTVQLTPEGQAIIVMRDGQTIGGYPRVFQCTHQAINHLAQLTVGDTFTFKLIELPD